MKKVTAYVPDIFPSNEYITFMGREPNYTFDTVDEAKEWIDMRRVIAEPQIMLVVHTKGVDAYWEGNAFGV